MVKSRLHRYLSISLVTLACFIMLVQLPFFEVPLVDNVQIKSKTKPIGSLAPSPDTVSPGEVLTITCTGEARWDCIMLRFHDGDYKNSFFYEMAVDEEGKGTIEFIVPEDWKYVFVRSRGYTPAVVRVK